LGVVQNILEGDQNRHGVGFAQSLASLRAIATFLTFFALQVINSVNNLFLQVSQLLLQTICLGKFRMIDRLQVQVQKFDAEPAKRMSEKSKPSADGSALPSSHQPSSLN
jgi:hypothetical protein